MTPKNKSSLKFVEYLKNLIYSRVLYIKFSKLLVCNEEWLNNIYKKVS